MSKRIHMFFDVVENEDGELPGDLPTPNELRGALEEGLPDEWWSDTADAWHLVYIGTEGRIEDMPPLNWNEPEALPSI